MSQAIPRIAMIGGGQMALALAAGFVRSGLVEADHISVFDPLAAARERIAAAVPGIGFRDTATEAVASAGLVFLCVKPQQAAEAAATVTVGGLSKEAIVVSIVAGLRLDTLRRRFATDRVVRVMPNTPCLVGRGVSVVCRTPAVDAASMQTVGRLLSSVGTVHEVQESKMDAVTGLSGSGPGFIAYLLEALIEGGVAAGLDPQLADSLARETLSGTASLLEETGEPPAEIRRKVSSPGGTTLAGLASLDAHGVRAAVAGAVAAAADRAAELSRG